MHAFGQLGIAPTRELRAIKAAYAKRLRVTRPDDDPAAYQALREAYERALRWAKEAQEDEVEWEPEPETGTATEPEPEPETEPVTVTEPDPESEPETDPVTAPAPVAAPVPAFSPPPHQRWAPTPDLPPPPDPAALVANLDRALHEGGQGALLRVWPELLSALRTLPLGEQTPASRALATWLLATPRAPRWAALELDEHFQWSSDFRAVGALGAERADELARRLAQARDPARHAWLCFYDELLREPHARRVLVVLRLMLVGKAGRALDGPRASTALEDLHASADARAELARRVRSANALRWVAFAVALLMIGFQLRPASISMADAFSMCALMVGAPYVSLLLGFVVLMVTGWLTDTLPESVLRHLKSGAPVAAVVGTLFSTLGLATVYWVDGVDLPLIGRLPQALLGLSGLTLVAAYAQLYPLFVPLYAAAHAITTGLLPAGHAAVPHLAMVWIGTLFLVEHQHVQTGRTLRQRGIGLLRVTVSAPTQRGRLSRLAVVAVLGVCCAPLLVLFGFPLWAKLLYERDGLDAATFAGGLAGVAWLLGAPLWCAPALSAALVLALSYALEQRVLARAAAR
jgi:hypothetical protein